MWLAVKALALRWILGRSLGGLLGVLLMFALPLAGILKVVGIPLLIVLGIIGLPLLLLLAVIGLPLLLVVGAVSVLMAAVTALLSLGVVVLKFALPVIAVVVVVRWLLGRRRSDSPPDPGVEPAS